MAGALSHPCVLNLEVGFQAEDLIQLIGTYHAIMKTRVQMPSTQENIHVPLPRAAQVETGGCQAV